MVFTSRKECLEWVEALHGKKFRKFFEPRFIEYSGSFGRRFERLVDEVWQEFRKPDIESARELNSMGFSSRYAVQEVEGASR